MAFLSEFSCDEEQNIMIERCALWRRVHTCDREHYNAKKGDQLKEKQWNG